MALNIVGCLSMSTIKKYYVTINAVCVHFDVSDNSETISDAELVACLIMQCFMKT